MPSSATAHTLVRRIICSRSAKLYRYMQTTSPLRFFNDQDNENAPSSPSAEGTPWIPTYKPRADESISDKRARLQYQSRKRGMLENGLLLSNFAAVHLNQFDDAELKTYDKLINEPSNDWSIFYWAIGKEKVPEEFDSEVFRRLQKYAQNAKQQILQPDLQDMR